MDTINLIRALVTLASLLLFAALVAHTWSRRRNPEHERAARLPFEEEVGVESGERDLSAKETGRG